MRLPLLLSLSCATYCASSAAVGADAAGQAKLLLKLEDDEGSLLPPPTAIKTDDIWSGPRMRSARIGASPVRQFLVGDSATPLPVWPLWFSANSQTGTAALENVYTQVSLAAASGVDLFTVVLTMADYLEHGDQLSPSAVSMLQRVVKLAPGGYIVLRVSFEGGATLGLEKNTIMSATNGSTMLCGCSWARKSGGPNGIDDCASPTAVWAAAAAAKLKKLLCAADAAIPHKIVGVQFVGLSTGEWELPHDDFVYTNGTCKYTSTTRRGL